MNGSHLTAQTVWGSYFSPPVCPFLAAPGAGGPGSVGRACHRVALGGTAGRPSSGSCRPPLGGGELPALGAHRGRKRKQSRASRAEQAEQSDRQGLGVGGHGARGGRGTAWSCVHSASPGVPRRRLSCRLWSFLLCREVGRRSEPHHTPAAIRYVLMPGCPV